MSPKGFTLLAAATAISLGLAAWAVIERDRPAAVSGDAAPMFADLLDRMNEVEVIRVSGGGESVTLRDAGESGWRIEERGGYPADPQRVRELALGLASLRLVEAKTAKPERLPRLELGDPTQPDAKARQVELLDGDGETVAAAVLGKTRFGLYGGGRSGVYVRRAGEDQAWLAAGEVDLPGSPTDLMRREILDLPRDEVGRITLDADGASPIVVARSDPEAAAFTLQAPLPEGRQADADKLERLAGTLSSLMLQDVRPAAEVSFPDAAPTVRFESWDGLAVDARVAQSGEGDQVEHWVTFAVSAREPLAPRPQPAEGEAAPPAEERQPLPERVGELKAGLDGWAFKLPEAMASRLTWRLDDLLASDDGTS